MANPTTNFGWQMPTSTDLVTDLPADFEVFGQAVDTSLVDLKGGTTGQVLSKASNTDMDFTWITNDVGDITAVTAGTGISGGGTSGAVTITNSMATEITAAGDIIVGTGSGTFDNLPIGTTGQVLTADTTVSPYKVKWAAAGGGSSSAVGCLVYSSVNQATTSAAYKNLEFNTEIYDTDGFHSTVTNTQRITIPSGKAGKYLFTFLVNFDGNATGRREYYLYKNGVSVSIMDGTVTSVGAQDTGLTFTAMDDAIVGDYYSVSVWQNSGTSLNVRAGREKNFFGAVYLGA